MTLLGHDVETNWGGNVEYTAATVEAPTSLDAVRSIVADATQVAAVASRHSFNTIGDATTLIDLRSLGSTMEFDASPVEDVDASGDASTVTVGAWTTYAELSRALAERGRALHNLASLPHISIGGAVSTGTHGSGSALATLSSAVDSVELLTAGGDIVTLRRGDPDFAGAVVGLGTLGLLIRVTLRTEAHYDVSQTVRDGLTWTTLTESFDEVFASATSVSVFTRWGDAPGELWCKQRADAGPPGSIVGDLSPADAMRHPIPGADTGACTRQLAEPGPWWNRLPHFRADAEPSAGREIQSECFVARSDSAAAIDALRAIGRELDDVLLVSEIRTVAADDLWMSPCFERDSTAFHFTWKLDPTRVQRGVDRVADALAPFDPRCHAGKALPTGWRVDAPRRRDFLDLKSRLDPTDRFTTDWFRHHVS